MQPLELRSCAQARSRVVGMTVDETLHDLLAGQVRISSSRSAHGSKRTGRCPVLRSAATNQPAASSRSAHRRRGASTITPMPRRLAGRSADAIDRLRDQVLERRQRALREARLVRPSPPAGGGDRTRGRRARARSRARSSRDAALRRSSRSGRRRVVAARHVLVELRPMGIAVEQAWRDTTSAPRRCQSRALFQRPAVDPAAQEPLRKASPAPSTLSTSTGNRHRQPLVDGSRRAFEASMQPSGPRFITIGAAVSCGSRRAHRDPSLPPAIGSPLRCRPQDRTAEEWLQRGGHRARSPRSAPRRRRPREPPEHRAVVDVEHHARALFARARESPARPRRVGFGREVRPGDREQRLRAM